MLRRVSRHAGFVLRQFAFVAFGVFVYFRVRGLTVARESVAQAHAHSVMALEHRLGLGWEHWFQSLLVGRGWLLDAANWVYIWGHWPVITVVMVWLAVRHVDIFLRLRNAMVLSGTAGLVIFATYPVAPPRLTDGGYIDTVTLNSESYRVLQPPAFVNPYAALPSLHVGWDLLVGISIITAASSLLLRIIGALMPVLMALAVVVTANHFVIDGLAGASLALAGLAGAFAIERVQRRRQRPHPDVPVPKPRAAADDRSWQPQSLAS